MAQQRDDVAGRVCVERVGWRDVAASWLVAKGLALASPDTRDRILHACADEWRTRVGAVLAASEARRTRAAALVASEARRTP